MPKTFITVIGRGYIGKMLTKRLGARYSVANLGVREFIADSMISNGKEKSIILWATGPGSSDITEQEYFYWLGNILSVWKDLHFDMTRHVILISSGGTIYGNCPSGTKFSEDATIHTGTLYSCYQHQIEILFKERLQDNLTILRLTNPYGPERLRLIGSGFISKAMISATRQTPLNILGNGEEERDYIYEDDFCNIVLSLVDLRINGTFNVGSGRSSSLTEIVRIIEKLTTRNISLRHLPRRPTDIVRSAVDTEKLLNLLSYPKITNLDEGILKTLEEYEVI
jgi:nucleoside-diphosphate-sugar epimerase